MMILVSAAPATLTREHGGPSAHLGYLAVPRSYGGAWEGVWAADNDCFQGLDAAAYLKMLSWAVRVRNDQLAFVSAPDVVGDALETLRRFDAWEPMLHEAGLPVALVGQDGLEADRVPWSRLEAFFVGGSTEWKLGAAARALVEEARRRGKWIHMGRVNTQRRFEYARALGCDSVDGTQFSMFRRTYLDRFLARLSEPAQLFLEEAEEAVR